MKNLLIFQSRFHSEGQNNKNGISRGENDEKNSVHFKGEIFDIIENPAFLSPRIIFLPQQNYSLKVEQKSVFQQSSTDE